MDALRLASFPGVTVPRDRHQQSSGRDSDIGIYVQEGLEIAVLHQRGGQGEMLEGLMRERFQIQLPQGPHREAWGKVALLCIGPGRWLAISEARGNDFVKFLGEWMGQSASVVDYTHSLMVLRLDGNRLEDALSRIVLVDLHPRVFGVGAVAVTVAAGIRTILWRLVEDKADQSVFGIAIPQSYAADFVHMLSELS